MIVKMQKVTLLVEDKYREVALKKLRELGVLHIHNVQNPSSEDINLIETELANVEKAQRLIGEKNIPQKEANLEKASIYAAISAAIMKSMPNMQKELEDGIKKLKAQLAQQRGKVIKDLL